MVDTVAAKITIIVIKQVNLVNLLIIITLMISSFTITVDKYPILLHTHH